MKQQQVKHVGWEIFEKSSLGTTNFENKVKYLRALEGWIIKFFRILTGVLRAMLKLQFLKIQFYWKKVINCFSYVSLKPGVFLTQKQIDGIKNFIASAVPDLKKKKISN